jgi:hypothetical protein
MLSGAKGPCCILLKKIMLILRSSRRHHLKLFPQSLLLHAAPLVNSSPFGAPRARSPAVARGATVRQSDESARVVTPCCCMARGLQTVTKGMMSGKKTGGEAEVKLSQIPEVNRWVSWAT